MSPPGTTMVIVKSKKKKKTAAKKASRTSRVSALAHAEAPLHGGPAAMIRNDLRLGQLWLEKCELLEARQTFAQALEAAREMKDFRSMMEALAGLLRVAAESLDQTEARRLDGELSRLMAEHPKRVPPMAWYCKGVLATIREEWGNAQRCMHRYLRMVKSDPAASVGPGGLASDEDVARGWISLANILRVRGRVQRSRYLAEIVLARYESKNLRGINGIAYLLLGHLAERSKNLGEATDWFRKAHSSFLGEHNWYHYLYVLYGYARIARMQQQYAQAYSYLDLMDKAASGAEFGILRREIARERSKLEEDAVDLLVDSRKATIKTRENGTISLGKQYILLSILEALSKAHDRDGEDRERGLSKAEIIERVWGENYRPEAHDNKLYYNINRLRKLIEPDVRQPQYLLNWKEGYRLAPGLRVHWIGEGKR